METLSVEETAFDVDWFSFNLESISEENPWNLNQVRLKLNRLLLEFSFRMEFWRESLTINLECCTREKRTRWSYASCAVGACHLYRVDLLGTEHLGDSLQCVCARFRNERKRCARSRNERRKVDLGATSDICPEGWRGQAGRGGRLPEGSAACGIAQRASAARSRNRITHRWCYDLVEESCTDFTWGNVTSLRSNFYRNM